MFKETYFVGFAFITFIMLKIRVTMGQIILSLNFHLIEFKMHLPKNFLRINKKYKFFIVKFYYLINLFKLQIFFFFF